ncbi:MAG: hypothetical protein ACJA1A_001446 [Saprospiraceae bacterium]|jgi:hypothetical protein
MRTIQILTALSTLILFTFISCEYDDDKGQQLDYNICTNDIVQESSRISQENLDVANWPTEIRSYFSSEFTGFSISTIISYKDVDNSKYYLLEATNGGQLLFDEGFNFICGDITFQMDSGKDDDEIDPKNLPQIILDYIEANYSGIEIQKAEFEDGEYEVKLNNGIELCFDVAGAFLGEC